LSTMESPEQRTIFGKVEASASFSSTAGYGNVEWSHEEEKAVVRKFDWRILPGLSVLYFLCFLDRAYPTRSFFFANIQGILGMLGSLR
jgi:hypothetical protein